MKMWKIGISVVCASILGSAAFAAYVGENFDSSPQGPVSSVGTWKATASSVVVTNAQSHSGSQSVMIPTLQTVSNAPVITATRVWTDFWTIPRPFVSTLDAAPQVPSSASAQFFISNTSWAVMSGPSGTTVRTYTQDWATTNISVVNDGSTWRHVSVLHDYNTSKWVLFVNGGPVSSNCVDFMATVAGYGWFAIENGGGDSTNRAWLDDVLITNGIPSSLVRDDDADTMLDAWELMYFNDLGVKQLADAGTKPDGGNYTLAEESYLRTDPLVSGEPTASYVNEVVYNGTNVSIRSMETNGVSGLRLNFDVSSDRTYNVLYTPSLGQAFSSVGSFSSGSGPALDWWVHSTALQNTRGYYKLNLVAGPWSLTNSQVYTFFKQSREKTSANPGSNFWVGVVVDYGPSNTLASTLGQQLAQGLDTFDLLRVFTSTGETTFRLESGVWVKQGTGPIDENTPIPLGVGMVISRANLGANTFAVMSGRMITSNSISMQIPAGMTMISWPFEGSNDLNAVNADLRTADNANDYIWVYDRQDQKYKKLRKGPALTAWQMSGGGAIPARVSNLPFGSAFWYSNTVSAFTWDPTAQ